MLFVAVHKAVPQYGGWAAAFDKSAELSCKTPEKKEG